MSHRATPPPPDSLWAAPAPVDPNVRPKDVPALTGQNAAILAMLKKGWVTPTDAMRIGCRRLAARCHDIKAAGYPVRDEYIPGSREKRYMLDSGLGSL